MFKDEGKMFAPPVVRIEPLRPDEWMDEAACAGLRTVHVPAILCEDCPVRFECGLLYIELDEIMMSGTAERTQHMPGTWGGEEHPEKEDATRPGPIPTNVGPCIVDGCDTEQKTMHVCQKHYERSKKWKAAGVSFAEYLEVYGGEVMR